jgi:hypothetical protein
MEPLLVKPLNPSKYTLYPDGGSTTEVQRTSFDRYVSNWLPKQPSHCLVVY